MICLYNNLGNSNINIATSNIADNKTTIYNRDYKRKYPEEFFDSLYANFAGENAVAPS